MVKKYYKATVKHTMTDARDCDFKWNTDFAKMTLVIRANFISPALLLHFLWSLPQDDERFEITGIVGAINITNRFNVRLELPGGTAFKIRAYQPFSLSDTRTEPLQLEFYELPKE